MSEGQEIGSAPQGLGVAAGVLFIPLVMMLVFAPDNWPQFCITLVLTTGMTIVGAFLGGVLVGLTKAAVVKIVLGVALIASALRVFTPHERPIRC